MGRGRFKNYGQCKKGTVAKFIRYALATVCFAASVGFTIK